MGSATEGIDSRDRDGIRSPLDDDRSAQQRVDRLIQINTEIARQRSFYRNEQERHQAELMVRPVSSEHAFAIFGAMIGSMPTASAAASIFVTGTSLGEREFTFAALLLFASACLTGLVGAALGRRVACWIRSVRDLRFPNRVAMTSLIGSVWGAVSGAAGGLIFFIIGALPAAVIGGLIGAIAVPIFAALHNSVRYGDVIEAKHLLPITLGITLSLCAFLLGL